MLHIDENKAKIARSDALRLLVDLARSKDQRVQRNATGALLNMTHTRMYIYIYIICIEAINDLLEIIHLL